MDMSFPSLDVARPAASPLGLDYFRLVASLAAAQAISHAASVEARASAHAGAPSSPIEALVALIEAKPGWAASIAKLGASFHPAAANALAAKLA